MTHAISQPTPERLLVFIPAYRCARQVVRVLEQFRSPAVHAHCEEILVLDNRSPDDTVQAACEKAAELSLGKVRVGRNLLNYGLGGSHKSAFGYAIEQGFSHIMVLHGDDQGDVRDIMPLLREHAHHDFDCCLGARFHPQSRLTGYSPLRIGGNRVFNTMFSLVAGQRLLDLGSGLNLYRVSSLASRYWQTFPDNLMFNYCMILAHVERNDRMYFFPISWREEDQLSNVRLWSQAGRTLRILWRFFLDRRSFLSRDFRDETSGMDSYSFETVEKGL